MLGLYDKERKILLNHFDNELAKCKNLQDKKALCDRWEDAFYGVVKTNYRREKQKIEKLYSHKLERILDAKKYGITDQSDLRSGIEQILRNTNDDTLLKGKIDEFSNHLTNFQFPLYKEYHKLIGLEGQELTDAVFEIEQEDHFENVRSCAQETLYRNQNKAEMLDKLGISIQEFPKETQDQFQLEEA